LGNDWRVEGLLPTGIDRGAKQGNTGEREWDWEKGREERGVEEGKVSVGAEMRRSRKTPHNKHRDGRPQQQ
jgi:hypothetical protein